MTHPSRREWLRGATALGAVLATGGWTWAQDPQPATPPPAPKPLFPISLAQWSVHNLLFKKELDNLEFPRFAKQEFGINAVEFVNSFFKDKVQDLNYLRELKKRADDEGVRCCLIMIDGEGALAHEDQSERDRAIANHRKWIDAAAFLGCHSIRVNLEGTGSRSARMKASVESLRALGNYADPVEIRVIVENHGGFSSDGEWLSEVMRTAAHKRVGTLPDFGNFRIDQKTEYDRYKGVKELMPWACAVSAKSYDFDEQGNETTIDYARMLKIVIDAGYRSWVGIEYEGSRLSERDGIRATQRLLEKLRTPPSQPK